MAGRAGGRDGGDAGGVSRYQVVRIEAGEIRHWARRYDRAGHRWVTEPGQEATEPEPLPVTVRVPVSPPPPSGPSRSPHGRLLDRVREVCQIRLPDARITAITPSDGPAYLNLVVAGDGGEQAYAVGAQLPEVTERELRRFAADVHARYQRSGSLVRSLLVAEGGGRSELVALAADLGIRLTSFADHQAILDLREYRTRLRLRLDSPLYPERLYVPQRYELPEEGGGVRNDILAETMRWLADPDGRCVLVVGDFGTGKTFLLNQLARRIPRDLPHLLPILVELGALEKPHQLNELVALHLTQGGETDVNHTAFRYMLSEGRIALLFDGYDELAGRVSYEHAADQLQTLLEAARGRAKVVVACRSQHFRSDQQARSVLEQHVRDLPSRRMVRLHGFDNDQVRRFLVKLFDDDEERADRRLELVREIGDLLGLSRNPRMLSFIAELPEERLEEVRSHQNTISAATLYRLILSRWLEHEFDYERRGLPPRTQPLSVDERWEAARRLAVELWSRPVPRLSLSELEQRVAAIISQLPAYEMDARQAAHVVGSGTLLVRDEEARFSFVHESVLEWLVAAEAARRLSLGGQPTDLLGRREMSELIVAFFCDLAGSERAEAWAGAAVLQDMAGGDIGRRNALLVLRRLGSPLPGPHRLHGQDLRGENLSDANLRQADLGTADLSEACLIGADLREANLEGARLVRARLDHARLQNANLRGVDLTGATLAGADLRGAALEGAVLRRTALIGARLERGVLEGLDTWSASTPDGREIALQLMPALSQAPALAYSPELDLVAIAGGSSVQLWDAGTGQPLRTLPGHAAWVSAVWAQRQAEMARLVRSSREAASSAELGEEVRTLATERAVGRGGRGRAVAAGWAR